MATALYTAEIGKWNESGKRYLKPREAFKTLEGAQKGAKKHMAMGYDTKIIRTLKSSALYKYGFRYRIRIR